MNPLTNPYSVKSLDLDGLLTEEVSLMQIVNVMNLLMQFTSRYFAKTEFGEETYAGKGVEEDVLKPL